MSRKRLRSPIRWYGGKGILAPRLLQLMPDSYEIYVEVFGGGASLLFAKEPHGVEVYNDIDGDLVNLFRVLRSRKKFEKFYRKVALTLYSREEWQRCRSAIWKCKNSVERAYRFFVMCRQSFSGSIRSWSFTVSSSARGMSQRVSSWLGVIESLPAIHHRLMRVQIDHDDFKKIIPRYDSEKTFFYCDPPYVPGSRRASRVYDYEMSDRDHHDLVDLLISVRGKVMLSGYANPIYRKLEELGWIRVDFETVCHAAGQTKASRLKGRGMMKKHQPRIESIWMNYIPPLRRGGR